MATSKWELGNNIIGRYSPRCGASNNGSLQLFIPEIMPKLQIGVPKKVPVPLNKGCFCNAAACKPSVSNTIYKQNYITVPIYANNFFQFPYLYQNDMLRIDVLNGNVDNMFVTNRFDPSHLKPR